MLTRGGEDDRRRDEQRDVERDQRVQQRYGRFFEEEEINSVEEEDQAVKPGSSTSSEEIVEIEAPQLKTKPKPLCSFEDESIPDFVKQVVRHMGFTQPTIIQKYCKTMLLLAIPIALLGCDMIAIAKTGSGKTFSYMIPCLMKVASVRRQIPHHRSMNGFFQFFPLGLILAPTRELAIQIYDSSMMLAVRSGLKLSVVYGGAKKDCQLGEMSDGVDVLIATPGRLIDFLNCGSINLSTVQFFVLDEADRMLVKAISESINPGKQTMFLSATWPCEVQELSSEICKNSPVKLKIGEDNLTLNSSIIQNTEYVSEMDKRRKILDLMKSYNDNGTKFIVFTRTKKNCDRVCKMLENEGYRAIAIHGDKHQKVEIGLSSKEIIS